MSVWEGVNFTHRFSELPSAFFTYVTPQLLDNTRWVVWNGEFAQQFGLPAIENEELLNVFAGQKEFTPFAPLAMKYAGHQFGVYNPDLGDGRGLLLAEMQHQDGTWFDIHLKGVGLTPYSRMGDGRAVLRSTIREYLCSEAMAGLGIPTTRALGMMDSDTPVYREKMEYGALLIRVAETHIRFGHFEHFFYTNQLAEQKLLADKVIEWHFPECSQAEKPYAAMFESVVEKTAEMIAYWQAYGFAHGVMNTDNMSILGQTFDYGPFGFLDDYDPNYICNHSDYQGRYAFEQQPRIALWNLSALAHSLSPLVQREDLEAVLGKFELRLSQKFSELMRAKLGLHTKVDEDGRLFEAMFELLNQNKADYTRFFRELSNLDVKSPQSVIDLFIDREAASAWVDLYLARCELEVDEYGERVSAETRCEKMRRTNPKYILRNYLAQLAIDKAEEGDFSEVNRLAELLKRPYDEQPEFDDYAKLPPEWGKKMEISCSS
ncbi:Protein adenylyltransferase SelO [Vibrio sp. B1ASS3]|uniref:protein adenylyltransferase SelO n=1 Tax=Vibrio sp. B1ASS3 TaxID=2751176 RepID=UPI001ABB8A7D|nr:YdiU family protein [Vibrio sp. B1ASS3]CAD7813426.1 Protein adenylyltransferase SelO [Vibrio sp. B1ASS3]CAE6919909.1 Protein adenylyltransferase SelO [Vibrio sp. B1ASS3]